MLTTTQAITLRILKATDGHKLCRKGEEGADRPYFTDTIYLGTNDTEDNYAEYTDAEVTAYVAAAEERQRAKETPPETAEAEAPITPEAPAEI